MRDSVNVKLLTTSLMLLLAPAAFADTYTVDATHTSVSFKVRHMMVSYTKGKFTKFEGTLNLDDKAPEKSEINVTIDASSVNTELKDRDEHLRSPEFFDTAKYPNITFKSKKVKVVNPHEWKVTGDITIRGVTKEVVLNVSDIGKDVKDPWGNVRRGAVASTKVNRKDFGLQWNKTLEAGGVAVGDDVLIDLDIELIKKA